jgi:hypothetical protein
MNQLEFRYALELEARKQAGAISDYRYEPMRLILAKRTSYLPDFLVLTADGEVEFHEVKGFMRDDAHVKLKVAAATFPFFRFWLVRAGKRGEPEWKVEEVAP